MSDSAATPYAFTKLVVHDLEGMRDFYENVYGLREFDRVKAAIGGRRIDEIMLGVDSGFGPGSLILLQFVGAPAPTPGAIILGFVTSDLDDLVDRVVRHGGSVHEAPSKSEAAPVRVAFVRDPEGNLTECVQMLE